MHLSVHFSVHYIQCPICLPITLWTLLSKVTKFNSYKRPLNPQVSCKPILLKLPEVFDRSGHILTVLKKTKNKKTPSPTLYCLQPFSMWRFLENCPLPPSSSSLQCTHWSYWMTQFLEGIVCTQDSLLCSHWFLSLECSFNNPISHHKFVFCTWWIPIYQCL